MARTFELLEYHDFEPEEQLLAREQRTRLGVHPFEPERCAQRYVQHLPEEHVPEHAYPWRDRAWQGDWLWQSGGLSRQEAFFWFSAMTHPLRHTETQFDPQVPGLLMKSWFERPWEAPDVGWATQRMRSWFEEERRTRPQLRWFSYSYLTRLLVEFFEVGEVLGMLMEVIPIEHVRHFFVHLEPPKSTSKELQAQVAACIEQVDVTRSHDEAYAAIRLLERLPHALAAYDVCGRLHACEDRSPTLVRDAVNLLEDGEAFTRWFNAFEDYHIAQEMVPSLVLRGGFELVEALMQRTLDHDDRFIVVAFKDLLRLHSWRCVEGFLVLSQRKMFAAASRDWLVSNGQHSVQGLCEVWLDKAHASSRDALRFLEEMCARGRLEFVQKYAQTEQDPARQQRIQDELIARYIVKD